MSLFATLRTLSLESSLFSTIFHVNIRAVLRRTARIIVLIQTIGLSKIRRTSYEKSFHSKFLSFSSKSTEKPRKVLNFICILFAQYCRGSGDMPPPPSMGNFGNAYSRRCIFLDFGGKIKGIQGRLSLGNR